MADGTQFMDETGHAILSMCEERYVTIWKYKVFGDLYYGTALEHFHEKSIPGIK